MGSLTWTTGAPSRRDRRLPYTYEAWVDILAGQGDGPVWDHYFSATICGLLETLEAQEILPGHVRIYGLYRGVQRPLELSPLIGADGNWLQRPELCRMLERRFRRDHDECYRGHTDRDACAFADRDRRGSGPLW